MGKSARAAASHPSPELMQLRKPELFGPAHHDGVRARNIEPAFHDIGRQQHVRLAVDETHHAVVDLVHSEWAPLARPESFAFSAAPKCCSSSMMTRPRSANFTSFAASACVPTTTFSVPRRSPSLVSRVSGPELARDRLPTSIPRGPNRL